MNDKFKMELTWHNCATHPPKEWINETLFVSDGESIHKARYNIRLGWWCVELWDYIPNDDLNNYWWADIQQTIDRCASFKNEGC